MKRWSLILLPCLFAACSLIDDDLSVCGEKTVINYQLQLHTELSMQLQTELSLVEHTPVRAALEQWLAPVFTDKAKDIDLRFFSWDTDVIRYQIQDVINTNRTSYTIVLPQEDYMHLGVANLADNGALSLADGAHSATMQLVLPEQSGLPSMNTGVFTARLPLQVTADTSQSFSVYLYMVNAAVALVIDTTVCDSLVSSSGCMTGGACSFSLRDSLYSYASTRAFLFNDINIPSASASPSPVRRARAETADRYTCLATVCMPTADGSPWTVVYTATLTGGRHSVTTLTVDDPLKAGTLRIIKLTMSPDGTLTPDASDHEVGASVALDWSNGSSHDVEL